MLASAANLGPASAGSKNSHYLRVCLLLVRGSSIRPAHNTPEDHGHGRAADGITITQERKLTIAASQFCVSHSIAFAFSGCAPLKPLFVVKVDTTRVVALWSTHVGEPQHGTTILLAAVCSACVLGFRPKVLMFPFEKTSLFQPGTVYRI